MNGQFLDILAQRRIDLHFISPAICEGDFSSTGEVSIILEPFNPRFWGSGPVWFFNGVGRQLWWGTIPGVICISVYQNIDGEYQLIAECIDPNVPWDIPGGVDPKDIVITVIDDDGGESNPSPPPTFAGTCPHIESLSPATGIPLEFTGCDPVTLTINATGSPPLNYQWYKGTTLMHQSVSNSYTFPMAKNLAGSWSAVVSNTVPGCGSDADGAWDVVYKPLDIVTLFDEEGACIGDPYLFTFGAEGGTPIDCDHYAWTIISGALPDGLSLDEDTGEISGTAMNGGVFTFTVQAGDDEGDTDSEEHTIVVIEFVTESPLENGLESEAYSATVVADPPGMTFSVIAGALPTGLSMDANGNITGTPTLGGTYNFTVRATSAAPVWSCDNDYAIKIWYADNTLMVSFGDTPEFNRDYLLHAAATPGRYKVDYDPQGFPYGTGIGWAFLGDGIKYPVYPHGAYTVWTTGKNQADGSSATTPNLYTIDGPLGIISGWTAQDPSALAGRATATASTLAQNPLLIFDLEVVRDVRFQWAMRPAAFFTDNEPFFTGGIGPAWNLIRIGKATP